jgi:hypothetical protein
MNTHLRLDTRRTHLGSAVRTVRLALAAMVAAGIVLQIWIVAACLLS